MKLLLNFTSLNNLFDYYVVYSKFMSFYIWKLSMITFLGGGGGGPLPGPQGVRRDMYRKSTWGVGDHFQVLKVPEGTCTVFRTYLPTILSDAVSYHLTM